VLRELKEEYGCEGVIEEQLPAVVRIREKDGVKSHWVTNGFIIRAINPSTAKINEPASMDEIGWFPLSELPEPLHSCIPLDLEENPTVFAKFR
jgi:ADP-ribose pyrophosphatase YjhB (NUDIX family)